MNFVNFSYNYVTLIKIKGIIFTQRLSTSPVFADVSETNRKVVCLKKHKKANFNPKNN